MYSNLTCDTSEPRQSKSGWLFMLLRAFRIQEQALHVLLYADKWREFVLVVLWNSTMMI